MKQEQVSGPSSSSGFYPHAHAAMSHGGHAVMTQSQGNGHPVMMFGAPQQAHQHQHQAHPIMINQQQHNLPMPHMQYSMQPYHSTPVPGFAPYGQSMNMASFPSGVSHGHGQAHAPLPGHAAGSLPAGPIPAPISMPPLPPLAPYRNMGMMGMNDAHIKMPMSGGEDMARMGMVGHNMQHPTALQQAQLMLRMLLNEGMGEGRRRRKRRRVEDLSDHERWSCPFSCGKVYRKNSTISIRRHRQVCNKKTNDNQSLDDSSSDITSVKKERRLHDDANNSSMAFTDDDLSTSESEDEDDQYEQGSSNLSHLRIPSSSSVNANDSVTPVSSSSTSQSDSNDAAASISSQQASASPDLPSSPRSQSSSQSSSSSLSSSSSCATSGESSLASCTTQASVSSSSDKAISSAESEPAPVTTSLSVSISPAEVNILPSPSTIPSLEVGSPMASSSGATSQASTPQRVSSPSPQPHDQLQVKVQDQPQTDQSKSDLLIVPAIPAAKAALSQQAADKSSMMESMPLMVLYCCHNFHRVADSDLNESSQNLNSMVTKIPGQPPLPLDVITAQRYHCKVCPKPAHDFCVKCHGESTPSKSSPSPAQPDKQQQQQQQIAQPTLAVVKHESGNNSKVNNSNSNNVPVMNFKMAGANANASVMIPHPHHLSHMRYAPQHFQMHTATAVPAAHMFSPFGNTMGPAMAAPAFMNGAQEHMHAHHLSPYHNFRAWKPY